MEDGLSLMTRMVIFRYRHMSLMQGRSQMD